jgi:hypothetical protein
MQDLAKLDKAVFWAVLGSTTVTRKSTFTDGAPTEMTDASVLEWSQGEYDYEPMFNEYHLYGIRIGDEELYVNTADLTPDPGAASKTKYGVDKSDKVTAMGAVSEYELAELGKVMVTKDASVNLFLRANIKGFSTLRLGDEVNITSTLLNLPGNNDASKYVITHWGYNNAAYRTTIRLHPRVSQQGFIDHILVDGEKFRMITEQIKQADVESRVPSLTTQTW